MTDDERRAAYLATLLPDLLNVLEVKFAGAPGLAIDLLAQALGAWAIKIGASPDDVKGALDAHWDDMEDYVDKYVTRLGKADNDGR